MGIQEQLKRGLREGGGFKLECEFPRGGGFALIWDWDAQ